MDEETFGQRIQRLRREADMTQREVASRLSIDFTYLSKLENDRGEPPGETTVRRLAENLGDDAEELLALAGKLPSGLRERAQEDTQFARFLRRLPEATEGEMTKMYRTLKIKPPDD